MGPILPQYSSANKSTTTAEYERVSGRTRQRSTSSVVVALAAAVGFSAVAFTEARAMGTINRVPFFFPL